MGDLQKAICIGQAVFDATPENHSDRARRLNNLVGMLSSRYKSSAGSMNDLQEAIRIGQAAVDATCEDHAVRARCLDNLSTS